MGVGVALWARRGMRSGGVPFQVSVRLLAAGLGTVQGLLCDMNTLFLHPEHTSRL